MKKLATLISSILIISSCAIGQLQIQNPGFEEWEDAGTVVDEPVNWSSIKTSDAPAFNGIAPVVWGISDDAHSGNYSLSLFNVVSLVIATGTTSNGRYHTELPASESYVFTDENDDKWNSPISAKPDSIVGWYKCSATEGDFGTIKVILHKGYAQSPGDESDYIAMAYKELPSAAITEWTRFSIPFEYYSNETPAYYLAILTSGNGEDALPGSTALFDDLEFIYNGSSVDELPVQELNIHLQKNKLIINTLNNTNSQFDFVLHNVNGRIVHSTSLDFSNSNSIDINHLKNGMYIATATNSEEFYMRKVMIIK